MGMHHFYRMALDLGALLLATLPTAVLQSATPVVVFDVPLTVECRDVTPKSRSSAYPRKVVEAVLRISPQIYSGDEADVKRLHYEISTEQQMPVVGFLPNAEMATDVAGGTIAIQAAEHHGNLSFRYLVLPTLGNGELRGDLESSRVQYSLLAPKQVILAAGTIQRSCGVFYDLRASTQDTLQRPRDFACLFEVPKSWRADYVTVRSSATGIKRLLAGLAESEAECGQGLLCVGLYLQDDEPARQYADELARKQQRYLRSLAGTARQARDASPASVLGALGQVFVNRATRASAPSTKIGAAVAATLDEHRELEGQLSSDARDAAQECEAVKKTIRQMNGSPRRIGNSDP